MTSHKPRRLVLAIALNLAAIAPPLLAALFAKSIEAAAGDRVFTVVLGVAVAWSLLLNLGFMILHYRGLDEVQRAAQQFAIHWGWAAGILATPMLFIFTPYQSLVFDLATTIAGDPGREADQVVILAFMSGFITLVLMQVVGMAVASVGWQIAKR